MLFCYDDDNMEGGPKFRATKETPHGSHLERVRESDPGPRDLSSEERGNLRDTLSDLGVSLNESSDEEDEPESAGRRNFLRGAIATAVAASVPSVVNKNEEVSFDTASEEVTEPEEVESVEQVDTSESFNAQVEGFAAFTQLQKDEVLYVDESGRPVGRATLEDFEGPLPPGMEAKEGQAPVYLYSVGERDETGLPVDKIPPRWRQFKQAELQAKNPNRPIVRDMNVVADFQAAYNEADEPELVAKIANGEIDSYDEIVGYFVEKPVNGHEEYNRLEYTRTNLRFRSEDDEERGRPAVPELVQEELRRVVPGLFAQESKFNAGLVSSAGAAGLAQIKPQTWKEYKGTDEVSLRMDEQLEVVGELMSDNYHYLLHYAGENIEKLREQYDTEEEFNKDLIVPLLVNAYNVGGPGIGKMVNDFVENTPQEFMASGKDLFMQFSDFSYESNSEDGNAYGDDAREYVQRVYGNQATLDKKYTGM